MYKRLIAAALVFGMAANAPPASAQVRQQLECAERAHVVGQLERIHGEELLAMGLAGPSAVMEVWRSHKSGSWTLLLTRPNRVSCIVAAGENWLEAARPAAPVAKSALRARRR